jgi:hypothetical protein
MKNAASRVTTVGGEKHGNQKEKQPKDIASACEQDSVRCRPKHMVENNEIQCSNAVQKAPEEPPINVSSKGGKTVEVSVRGKRMKVPAVQVHGRTVAIKGKWLKVASIFDEATIDGEVIEDPESFLRSLRHERCGADIFTFPQRLPEVAPKYPYPFEWDNLAAVRITTYEEWFGKRIGTDVKQNIKKALKRGVVARCTPFDDRFVQGIVDIYNESRIRQGRVFWHYGKDFDTVKHETGHCLEKSQFIGAYCGDELVGFVKLLRAGATNDIVLIVCKQSHLDKKPMNALLAKAVELCAQKGIPYLTYAKLVYGNKVNSSLAEFKRRHGFEQINFPRYFVPLTLAGRLGVKLKFYREIQEMIPETILNPLLAARARLYNSDVSRSKVQSVALRSGAAE